MPRLSRAELHSRYQEYLDYARRWREDEGYDQTWRRMVDLYRGKHWPMTTLARRDLISVNLAFSTINVIAPSVSVNHPKIVVRANNPAEQGQAAFIESIVNYMWRHHDYRKPFRRAVKDFLIVGHGWVKVGWRFVEQERMLSEEERQFMFDEAVVEANVFASEAPGMAAELPSNSDIASGVPETGMTVVEDQPFVERISPFDMFVDPEATCLDDMNWIAQRVIRPLEEAQRDKRYKAGVRKRLTADAGVNPMYSDSFRERRAWSDPEERVTIWEYYDVEANTMSVFAENSDEFLIDPVQMPYAYGQPFVMLRNFDVPDFFYPIGELEPIESLQLELDKTRSQLMNDRKRYARKYLYHERSFGPEGREALESDDDGRLVPVVDENKPLSEVVVPMPQTSVSPEIYAYSQTIEEDINTVSGVSEYARGAMPEIRRTATEASIIADAQNARAADKLATVELAIGFIGRRVIQLLQQFMTGEAVARIELGGSDAEFIEYSREQILGEYDFQVEGGSTQPLNDTIRKQQAVSLMNALGPLIGTVVDPAALAMHVLEQGFDIKDPQKFIIQQTPMAPAEAEQLPSAEGGPLAPAPPLVPPAGGGVSLSSPEMGAFAPTGGIPPELLAQLQNQMGLELPAL